MSRKFYLFMTRSFSSLDLMKEFHQLTAANTIHLMSGQQSITVYTYTSKCYSWKPFYLLPKNQCNSRGHNRRANRAPKNIMQSIRFTLNESIKRLPQLVAMNGHLHSQSGERDHLMIGIQSEIADSVHSS